MRGYPSEFFTTNFNFSNLQITLFSLAVFLLSVVLICCCNLHVDCLTKCLVDLSTLRNFSRR